MKRRRFKLSHSVVGIASLIVFEYVAISFLPHVVGITAIMISAIAGGIGIIVIATDVIEEVPNRTQMLVLLTSVVCEFIVFFAFQYRFLGMLDPGSYQNLFMDPISLLLQSTMIFALNPLYLPLTMGGRILLLIQTLESLVLALFVLQNIWQFRSEK